MKRSNIAFVLLMFVFWVVEVRPQSIFSSWEIAEFQPDIPNGGRANTFAVNPVDANRIFVTSESGGLFRSSDRGATWRHVDSLPCYRTMSVAQLPANPNILLVTTLDDLKASTGGGIWRSIDGGASWSQASLILPGWATGRMQAYEISIEPGSGDIYAASEFGVFKSSDQGANWNFQDAFGGGDRRVFSLLALGGGRIIAGGPSGIRRSDTGGASWNSPAAYSGIGIWDLHAFGRSPLSNSQAFVADGDTKLYYTENSGLNWAQIAAAPGGGGGCGGITFARTANRSGWSGFRLFSRFDLYFGNRCGMAKLLVTRNIITGVFNYSGAWQNLNMDHGDTRDLAFDNAANANPILLATDGGIHKTADGGLNWTFTGGGRNGFNALQITEVQGQLIEDIGRYDFYFGTQDNDLWSSGSDGASWVKGMCCEGFFIEAQKKVSTAANSKITNVTCAGCGNILGDPLFTNLVGWPNATTDPGGNAEGNPVIVRRSLHIQGVNNTGAFTKGLAVTNNLGASWQQYASFPDDRRDIPKVGRAGSGRVSTYIYQAYRAPGWYAPGDFEINKLARIRKGILSATATVSYPAMNNFGALGINPTMFAWYQVFAIDPGNYLHLIAPDIINNKMMETRDGGENWSEIPGLTDLVTDGGRLRFSFWMFPLVSAISFSPQNPNFVVLGTWEGGAYLSIDNGATWRRINNSEGLTNATGFAWKNANDVMISSYGRGLWRLKHRIRIPRFDEAIWCRAPCLFRPFDISDPIDTLDRGIIIYDGRVMGASVVNGVVREVFVSTGSSVVFVGEKEDLGVKVSEVSKEVGFRGVSAPPKAPQRGWIVKGLAFGKQNELKGALFGDKPMAMYQEKEQPEAKDSNTRSPSLEKPYVQLSARRFDGAPVASPNETLSFTLANIPKNLAVAIYIDNKPVSKGRADAQGFLKIELRAPREFGLHSLTIRYGNDEKSVIDGTMFLVKHYDNFRRDNIPRPK